jgi:hemolysin D
MSMAIAAPRAALHPSLLAPEALDFAPDLLAIQERPPARWPRLLLGTVVSMVGALLLWAWFAQLDVIATAQGRLVPLTFTKVVQPAESGVVTEILVSDGDAVQKGQVLLRLDGRVSQADTRALHQEQDLRRLTLRRIEAELSERAFFPTSQDEPVLFAQIQAQFRARRQAYLDALAQEAQTLNRARADRLSAQQMQDKLTQVLPTYQKSAQAYRQLVAEGFVGDLAANEKNRELIEKEQELKAQAAQGQSLDAAMAQSERRTASVRSQYHSQLENERVETLTLLNRSQQELAKLDVRAGQLDIRAPSAGIVKDLAVTTGGAVVGAGAVIMNIVPREEPLQAEVQLNNEDVGFITEGQAVRLKVAAYPFQKYGLIDAKVHKVSADASDAQRPNSAAQTSAFTPTAPSYKALVRLSSSTFQSATTGEQLKLTPGMLITADIHQGQRSVLEYLLSPVRKVAQEAARER